MVRAVGILLSAVAATACVVGTEPAVSRLEIARGASGDSSLTTAGFPARCAGRRFERPPPPRPDAIWIDGGCHFDGARSVYVAGRWELPRAGERQ